MAARFRAGASGIALAVLGFLSGGCGGSQYADATDTARAFYAAVSDKDGAAACDLLTPGTRDELEQSSGKVCSTAILEELKPAAPRNGGDAEVYGVMAQVHWWDETVFLTRMPGGWRVLAAGCQPIEGDPYDCVVEGA